MANLSGYIQQDGMQGIIIVYLIRCHSGLWESWVSSNCPGEGLGEEGGSEPAMFMSPPPSRYSAGPHRLRLPLRSVHYSINNNLHLVKILRLQVLRTKGQGQKLLQGPYSVGAARLGQDDQQVRAELEK